MNTNINTNKNNTLHPSAVSPSPFCPPAPLLGVPQMCMRGDAHYVSRYAISSTSSPALLCPPLPFCPPALLPERPSDRLPSHISIIIIIIITITIIIKTDSIITLLTLPL